jgi:hypothetical protein
MDSWQTISSEEVYNKGGDIINATDIGALFMALAYSDERTV